jgi:opacity protein-like surface antigen
MRNGSIAVLRVIAALSGLAVSSAWAAETGFYFGVNVGQADFDVGNVARLSPPVLVPFSSGGNPGTFVGGRFLAVASASSSSVDERDATFAAALGYTFNRYVSVELSYADLGEATMTSLTNFNFVGNPLLAPQGLRVDQELSAETLAITVLGTYPLSERWSLFGRGGYGHSESDIDVRAGFTAPGSTPTQFSQDFDSDDFVVGAGVGYRLSSRWSLRLDYERIFEAGAEQVDVDRVGLSAILRL